MNVEFSDAAESLRHLYVLKEDIESIPDPQLRASRAAQMVVAGLRIVREALGKELIREAYGKVGADVSRDILLKIIAGRLEIASYLFIDFNDERGNLVDVATVARAVAHGDAPDLFARLPGRRTSHRLYRAKLEAHRWDAWLDGFGVPVDKRHNAIVAAFGEASWDTISRWQEPLSKRWGERAVSDRLCRDRSNGTRQIRMWLMHKDEKWEAATSIRLITVVS